MRYRTPEQKKAKNERNRKWKAAHREAYNDGHRNRMKEHREEHNERKRQYRNEDVNDTGVTKHHIRCRSRLILSNAHAKLTGYEIHHCFGYGDPSRFIYIPKSLHIQIHQLLRDNKIPADSDHWNVIRDLVNSCEEYTYIRC